MKINGLSDLIERIVFPMMRYAVPRLGKIVDLVDPAKKGRVLVTIDSLGWDTNEKGAWCYPKDKKGVITPAKGDYVLVEWLDGRSEIPMYSGMANNIKDMLPEAYDGDPNNQILFEGRDGKVKVQYNEGSDEMLIGKSGFSESARKNDATTSSSVEDTVFWAWLAAAGVVLAGLGVVPPIPTSLTGKINAGSSQIKVGDK